MSESRPPVAEDRAVDEVGRLQRCLRDLLSILALPAMWSGREATHLGHTLLDVLVALLPLDVAAVRLVDGEGGEPLEMVRIGAAQRGAIPSEQITMMLGGEPMELPAAAPLEGMELFLAPFPLGLHGEVGHLVVGARRPGFPDADERLLLNVAANQAAIGLREARLLHEQRRVASELDARVARRTAELAAANEELRRSEAFLAEGQQLTTTGSFAWRVATGEITWSDQLYRMFEFDRSKPVTLTDIGSRVHPDDLPLLYHMLTRAEAEASGFEYEHRLLMPDQSVKHLHLVAHARRTRDGALEYIGAVQDVTERRRSEEALGRLQSELAHMARITSLGALTASIAHEVNQPLSGIVTNASTSLRMLAADPPNVEGALETARRTIRDAKRASDVITRLRALFNRKAVTSEPVDLNEAAREVVALSAAEMQRGRVTLRAEYDETLPAILGDRVQLQQVMLNLLRNAVDAVSGIEDRTRLVVLRTGRDEAGNVRLSVEDSGPGLDPDSVPRLFEAFYSTKTGGMGIGLSVSRTIIEGHGGRLWAAPNEGHGATFAFAIPLHPARAVSKYRGDGGSLPTVNTAATQEPRP